MGKVGVNIRKEREYQELSVVELAKKAQISFQALYKIEHGEHSPRETTIVKIAEALKVSPIQLWL